jgi:hypothetical protein
VGTALKLVVVNVDTSVDDVDVNSFTTLRVVHILSECTEAKAWAVRNARKTPRRALLYVVSVYNLVPLNVRNLRHLTDSVYGLRAELAVVAADVTVIYMTNTMVVRTNKRVGIVGSLEEVHVVLDVNRLDVLFEDNNVRVV